jgi:hypothetical protein
MVLKIICFNLFFIYIHFEKLAGIFISFEFIDLSILNIILQKYCTTLKPSYKS